MVFEILDGLFGRTVLVHMWWEKLELDAFITYGAFEGLGGFIVEFL
jgi:hypothetical protein